MNKNINIEASSISNDKSILFKSVAALELFAESVAAVEFFAVMLLQSLSLSTDIFSKIYFLGPTVQQMSRSEGFDTFKYKAPYA